MPSFTLREGLVLSGLALLCAAAGAALVLEPQSAADTVPVAEAVESLRRWAGV